jgi:hypothetical protein
MMTIDDDMLMAFLDDELDAIARGRVERALADDPALVARLDVQRRLKARLAAHYAVADEVPERFRALLETNVVDLGTARARRVRPMWQDLAAIAATLLLGLAIGRTLLAPAAGPIGIDGGTMVAQADLARALDVQLASAQPANAPVRIGVSFAGTDGRLCRTFDSAAIAGLACRGDAGWQLMMTAAGSGAARSDYRQAGSASPLVLEAAQALMAGDPLDATTERTARDSGWRRERRPR